MPDRHGGQHADHAGTWRPVPGWPGLHASHGGAILSPGGVVLRPSRDRKGYKTVTVYRDGRKHTKRVHILVALAWLPAPAERRTQVRHLDGDKENCAAWNLKYGSQADQERDKVHAGASRAKRVIRVNGSEKKKKEGIRTGAYRAGVIRTSGTR